MHVRAPCRPRLRGRLSRAVGVALGAVASAALGCGPALRLEPAAPSRAAPAEVAGPVGAPGLGDPYYPGAGNGGYDVRHYDLQLAVDVEENTLEAVATIDARAEQDLGAFHLDLAGLEVRSVEVDGRSAAFEHGGGELRIVPAVPLTEGATFLVRVAYGGVPASVPDPGVPFVPGVGWWRTDSGIYVVSECIGAPSWFPCNDHPSDKATYSFRVTVAKPYVAAANGKLVEELDGGDERTYVFHASDPMATYLATLNVARFEHRTERTATGLALNYYVPLDWTEKEAEAFARTGEMVTLFERLFGPYPFESFGAVVAYERLGGALETQTLPVYSRGAGESTVAHELAHQWFGNCVTQADWRDLWLSEGFASYAEWLWREHARGPEALEKRARQAYRGLRKARIGPAQDPGLEKLFGGAVYVRGAWVLHALRREVGDEAFFSILREWMRRHRNANADTEAFVRCAEEVAGRPLRAFLEAWLRAPVAPLVPELEPESDADVDADAEDEGAG